MTERRYSEDEVAAIFRKATQEEERGPAHPSRREGMTLRELQDIGQEVGVAPALVAQAALALDQGGTPSESTFLGLPIGVSRTIELDRKLTDPEWEQLVVSLRETFNARGTVASEGSLRQWTNGNLQALLEPTPTGHRLRLRTINGNARAFMNIGLGALGAAAVVLLAKWSGGNAFQALPGVAALTAMGVAAFSAAALRLPGWAKLRARQMEGIGAQLSAATLLEPPR